ncbi:hypothetical protein K0M31_019286 [Melipona bicolor]|uniref:Uncharacterized protein n=1 Tax=Melipona bicolor TaxID=60889 RepID=A0AA40KQZ0_9HYME|nr:hypothetical protein K0M31_019286 [Melipona bicolor]
MLNIARSTWDSRVNELLLREVDKQQINIESASVALGAFIVVEPLKSKPQSTITKGPNEYSSQPVSSSSSSGSNGRSIPIGIGNTPRVEPDVSSAHGKSNVTVCKSVHYSATA